jgi:hypothetical protein
VDMTLLQPNEQDAVGITRISLFVMKSPPTTIYRYVYIFPSGVFLFAFLSALVENETWCLWYAKMVSPKTYEVLPSRALFFSVFVTLSNILSQLLFLLFLSSSLLLYTHLRL